MPKIALGHPFSKLNSIKPMLSGHDFKKCVKQEKSTLDIIPSMTHTLKDAGKNCTNQQKTYIDDFLPLNKLLVNDIVNFIKASS